MVVSADGRPIQMEVHAVLAARHNATTGALHRVKRTDIDKIVRQVLMTTTGDALFASAPVPSIAAVDR